MIMSTGVLFVLPSLIADVSPDKVLSRGLIDRIMHLDLFFVENIRTSRRFLSKLGVKNIESLHFELLNKDTSHIEASSYLSLIKNGRNGGILSEAGMPGIADPGSLLIRMAHQEGIRVIPYAGPSSIALALMASGFNGQKFAFHGYLPIEKKARKDKLIQLQNQALALNQTQVFMETPFRNNQLLRSIITSLNPDTPLCIASEITGENEYIRSQPVRLWKQKLPDLNKKPTIYLLFRP